jgi:hypothetical protein
VIVYGAAWHVVSLDMVLELLIGGLIYVECLCIDCNERNSSYLVRVDHNPSFSLIPISAMSLI